VLVESMRHRENLVLSMLTGTKPALRDDQDA
jgi:cytochrome b